MVGQARGRPTLVSVVHEMVLSSAARFKLEEDGKGAGGVSSSSY